MKDLGMTTMIGKSGYAGKDSMRDVARRELEGDLIGVPIKGAYLPSSAANYQPRAAFKKGGHVKMPRHMTSKTRMTNEMHIPKAVLGKPPKRKNVPENIAAQPTKGDKIKNQSLKTMANITPSKKQKGTMSTSKKTMDKNVTHHELIGERPKSQKYAGVKVQKVNKSVKAQRQPYDASHGQYVNIQNLKRKRK